MQLDQPTKKRGRRGRQRTGERPTITARDLYVFKLLTRYRYLDSRTLFQLIPPELHGEGAIMRTLEAGQSALENRFKSRLRRLYDWKYLHRTLDDQLDKHTEFRGFEIYELCDEGVHELAELGLQEEKITGLRAGNGTHFPHALMICSAIASLELDVRSVPGVRFVTGHEILAKAPPATRNMKDPWLFPRVTLLYRFRENQPMSSKEMSLRPDSPLFGFEYTTPIGKQFRFATLEVENKNRVWGGDLNQNSWFRKMLGYKIYRDQKLILQKYGIPNFFVYALGPSRAHVESMKAMTEGVLGKSGMFLFASIRAFGHRSKSQPPLIPHLFTNPLETAGKDLFYMATLDGKKPPENGCQPIPSPFMGSSMAMQGSAA